MARPNKICNEYVHLMQDYLSPQITFRHFGLNAASLEQIAIMLEGLHPFECPDMYAKNGNQVVALEHFVFDASSGSRKGLTGIREEKALDERAETSDTGGEWFFDKGTYEISLSNYQTNFEKCFYNHYGKIEDYKHHLSEQGILTERDVFVVGFWAEILFSPYYQEGNKLKGELFYFLTKQFVELIRKNKKISFMLFGGYMEGRLQLVYIDEKHLPPESAIIDLSNSNISLSTLSQNEVTVYCTM